MRITGGSARSRRLSAPRGDATRPTSERVREALFSILGPPPDGTAVLDLFAGAGTLGLESLSRGAQRAVFIDRSATAARFIRRNIGALGFDDASRVHVGDVQKVLGKLEGRFTWVFVDPPYAGDLASRALAGLADGRLLSEDAAVIVEHDRRNPPDPQHGCLVKADSRRYGDTVITIFRRAEP